MSIMINGIGLGGGIAIGNAYVLEKDIKTATQYTLESNELRPEINRFEDAIKATKRELELLRANIPSDAPSELWAFLSLHIMMLNDSQISQIPIRLIKQEECNAEWAIKLQADKLIKQFNEIEDEYLKERKSDVLQVLDRIYHNLAGNNLDWESSEKLERGILSAIDLSPADLVNFKNSNFSGFITEYGSLTSHTAIIGKSLEIPAVVGVSFSRQLIRDDDLLIIDGIRGVVLINPEPMVLNFYKEKQQQWQKSRVKLRTIAKELTITQDEIKIELHANIETPNDVEEVKYINASGIGLFRSEFLFLSSHNDIVDEDQQFAAYLKVVKAMKKLPVIIRTADLGADKNPMWNQNNDGLNPALGLTGIRLSLSQPSIFKTQLKAILRASHYGNIKIMFPMISSNFELKQAINQLEYAKIELKESNIPFDHEIKVGAMVEIPAIALAIKSILGIVDFISIGTNDLIQYLLAIDRNDERVNYLYNPLHPAVLKLLFFVIKTANKAGIPLSLCGEMAGNPKLTRLLLGMGLRSFSMYPSSILDVKQVILNTNISNTLALITKILKSEQDDKIAEYLNQLNYGLNIY